jgi:hypothetical protein
MTKTEKIFYTPILFLLLLPSLLLANAGTPLMWAEGLHLFIGNFFIGIGEGLILALLFKLNKLKTIGILIAANYFSAWVGGLFLRGEIVKTLPVNIHNAWKIIWLMVAVTYVITLILEFPFVVMAFRKNPKWFSKSIKGSLVIQSISYILLFGWYSLASGVTLYTNTKIVDLSSLSLPENVVLYYISKSDGNVYMRSLNKNDASKIYDLNSQNFNDNLFVQPSVDEPNCCDLFAYLDTERRNEPNLIVIQKAFIPDTLAVYKNRRRTPPQYYERAWFNFGDVPKLGSAKKSPWEFFTGYWPIEGLRGERKNTKENIYFALETPFIQWNIRNATHIPGDKVVFQLGDDQICIFDVDSRRVAFVTYGRGPIVTLKQNPQ